MLRSLLLLAALVFGLVACGGGGGPTGINGINLDAFEKELASLERPDGVDAALWKNLKQNLREAVLAGSDRETSTVPDSDADLVKDMYVSAVNEDGSMELDWGYRNSGDYNQDKLVNAIDLTPIGLYFGYTDEHADWPKARFADGNGDGMVSVTDITLLGQNYLQRVEGYQVGYGMDPAGEFTVLIDSVEFADGYLDGDTFQRRFTFTVTEPVVDAYYVVRPYDGEETGRPGNAVQYVITDPEITVTVPGDMQGGMAATWSAAWQRGTPPFTITWDLGDGAEPLEAADVPNPVQQEFLMLNDSRTDSAAYHYTVTVEDAEGYISVAEGDYTVSADPHPTLEVIVPDGMQGGLNAVWQFDWEYGTAPWVLECDFQDGADQLLTDPRNYQGLDITRQMNNDDLAESVTYEYTATVTDAEGYATTVTGKFAVGPCAIPVVEVTVPQDMSGGAEAEWTAEIQGGTGPYAVEWDFKGGADDPAPETGVEHTAVQTVEMINYDMVNSAEYTYKLKVMDSAGLYRYMSGDYTVGPGLNEPPVIESAAFHCEDQTMDITVSDLNPAESFTVTVTETAGFTVDATSRTIPADGSNAARFNWTVETPVAGRSGFSTVTVEDSHGATATTRVQMLMPEPDTLYAIPMQDTVGVDQPVTVLVLTGATSNPFLNACLISIECPDGMSYIVESWNPGAIGGGERDVDGIWSLMSPAPYGFGVKNIELIEDSGGLSWLECNCTPTTSGDLLGTAGDLFNMQFSFDTPGTYDIRFIEFSAGINRTYYEDWDEYSYPWGDCSNVHTGLVTTITVE